MNEFYNVITEMKADEKYIVALKKRAKTKNPKHALTKTKEYHEKIGMELFEFIDKIGILREVILGGDWDWGAWNGNGLALENDYNVLIFNEISESDIERVESIYNAWKNKTVPFEYGSNASEWREVAKKIKPAATMASDMDIKEFEDKSVQTYRYDGDLITYVLEYIDAENGYSIRSYDDRFKGLSSYDGDFLGTTPDDGNNVAMMAWEYNAVPVKEV